MSLKARPAQVHVEPDQPVETRRLGQQPHHVVAHDDHGHHERGHGAAGGGQAGAAQHRDRREGRQRQQLAQARPFWLVLVIVMAAVAGRRGPVGVGLVLGGRGPVGRDRGAFDHRGLAVLLPHGVPFRGDVARVGAGRGHGGRLGHGLERILRAGQPHFLAAGTAHGAPGCAQGSGIDGERRCTVGADDMHGAHLQW